MKPWDRFHIFTVPVVLALVLSALAVSPAFAAGSPPPPSDTPTGVTSPSSTSSSDTGASGQLAGTHQAAKDSGKHAPLARQQAANLAVNSDPQWCPSGVAPRSSATGGCSGSFLTLSLLEGGFVPTGNGTVWIKTGAVPGAGVIFDGLGFWSTARNFSLTFQGGWSGNNFSMGLAKANLSDPYPVSTLSDFLQVWNWGGNVTVRNVTLRDVSHALGGDYHALFVETQGNITLDRVQVVNTFATDAFNGIGAMLDNTSGAGNVKVSRSLFLANEGRGLEIFSKGSVTLLSIVANNNGDVANENGVFVDNTGAPFPKPVVVTKSEFDHNGFRGLEVSSHGAITLTSLTANNNINSRGVDAYNDYLGISSPITVKGVNNFSGNSVYGMSLFSFGAIKVSKITANFNNGDGVYLSNSSANLMPVTILGYLTAVGNSGDGLTVTSQGTVSAVRLNTSNNAGYGTHIDNTYAPSGFPRAVVISGVNVFNGNQGSEGLSISSNGAIKLSNITADFNAGNGANIDTIGDLASQSVTLTGKNAFDMNGLGGGGAGLYVNADGNIKLSNVSASYNKGPAGVVDNKTNWLLHPLFVPGSITISRGKFFGDDNLLGDILLVQSHGSVLLSHVAANYNTGILTYIIHIVADGNAKVSCSSVSGNSGLVVGFKVDMLAGHVLNLRGLVEDPLSESITPGVTVLRGPCP